MTKGPIIIVDDDADDLFLYEDAIKKIGIPNGVRLMKSAQEGLDYLMTTSEQPFILISDINMPRMNGLEFKSAIQSNDYLKEKGIPFVFISTNASKDVVRKAHQLSVQGYFEKPASMAELKSVLQKLFDYWELCKHINNT